MNVSIGERWEGFVAEVVKSGRYGSASEVVREGLRLVEERETKLKALRETIEASIARGGSHTSEEVMASVKERLAKLNLPARPVSAEAVLYRRGRRRHQCDCRIHCPKLPQSIGVGGGFAASIIRKMRKAGFASRYTWTSEIRAQVMGCAASHFGGYVIFFRYKGDVLEIVNVLEGHRDIDAYFAADDE